jgi:hypothetical protein
MSREAGYVLYLLRNFTPKKENVRDQRKCWGKPPRIKLRWLHAFTSSPGLGPPAPSPLFT